jgi:spermidine/putrescine transport system substrate-binding protein
MRKMLVIALTVVLTLASAGWATHARAAQKELKVFIWSEYIDPQIPKDFEKATGIKVKMDTYESNEDMMAKLVAGGDSQYDIIVPSEYIIPSLVHLHLLQKLNHALIPNLKNLEKMFRTAPIDPGNVYSAAYQWGTVGLLYRKDKIAKFENTWQLLFDPKMDPGPFYLMDDQRSMIGIALCSLGYDFNSIVPDELKQAADLLARTKKRRSCLGFRGGVGAKNDVVAGTAVAAIVYNGDGVRAILDNKDIHLAFTIPKEGSEIWYDNLAIPDKAPNPEAANQFINFILDAKVGAMLSNFNEYATPNEAAKAFITPADLKNPAIYPPPEVLKVLHFTKDHGNKMKYIDQAWTRAKSE